MQPTFLEKNYSRVYDPGFTVDRQTGRNATLPHWHADFELFYMSEGETDVFFLDRWNTLRTGDCLLIPPGMVHCVRCNDADAVKFVLGFKADVCPNGYFPCPDADGLLLHGMDRTDLPVLSQRLFLSEQSESRPSALMRRRSDLLRLLGMLTETWGDPTDAFGENDRLIFDVRNYLNRHFTEDISPYALADLFHISYSTLAKRWRRINRCTVMEYILFLRIAEAKKRLASTDESVSAIGATVGMPDCSYFVKIFHRETGMTPLHYRFAVCSHR